MRIRVYLDRTDRLWRVCGVGPGDPARVAVGVQAHRAGPGFPTWGLAMAAADRMAAKSRRTRSGVIAAAGSWQARR